MGFAIPNIERRLVDDQDKRLCPNRVWQVAIGGTTVIHEPPWFEWLMHHGLGWQMSLKYQSF